MLQAKETETKPKNHVGLSFVEQKALTDKDPYIGDRRSSRSWWTLLLSVLGKAVKSWHSAMQRLHELPVTIGKSTDLRTIVSSDSEEVQTAYREELSRVLGQRYGGDPRRAHITLGPTRTFNTLKKWLL